MQAEVWIVGVSIDDRLPKRRRKHALILSRGICWRHRRQQTRHARGIEKVGFVVDRAFRHACLSRTFFRTYAEQ